MKFPKDQLQFTAKPDQALQVWETTAAQLESNLAPLGPEIQTAFFQVLANSNFLARWTRRYPEKVAQTLKWDWGAQWTLNDFEEKLLSEMGTWKKYSETELASKLMDFKYKNLFRITARDMGLQKPFPEISREISYLSLSILKFTLDLQRHQLQEELGEVRTEKNSKNPMPFSIIGLGKLGGLELNFSSDVDLIYFYQTDEGEVFKNNRSTDHTPHHYFAKLGERFSRFLSKKTSEGFLYRVDLELRPEGKSGTLVNSLDAMETYYETFGAFWEKQAFIRSSFVAGSQKLYDDFHQIMQPFVYPKLADYSILIKLKDMKIRILDSVRKSSDSGYHLKLGVGGIREIEFFVQSLQVLYGGKNPTLQTPNTLEALSQVSQTGLISEEEKIKLTQAYIYLRTLENRLQQAEEQQTHRLPQEPEELFKLARRMNYRNPDPEEALIQMERDLEKHRIFVKNTFENLVAKRFEEQ